MARCLYPYMVERPIYHNQGDRLVPVPCGKCPQCLKRRLASWSFRLEQESLRWEKQFFVTLTYNTDHVPITPNGFLTLDKDHPTKFFKRLRKSAGKLRYYLCGEYGTNKKRPHYHAIIFGNETLHENDIITAWQDPATKTPFGDVYFGNVEAGSIRYTVAYYDKGIWKPAHRRDDRIPEYSTMSQGLGSNWLTTKQANHLIANPDKGYLYDREGKKIAIPAYYKKRLYDAQITRDMVANHPSLLIYRDEMQEAKKIHHEAIAQLMQQMPEEEVTQEIHEDRRMAIENYRKSKSKTRK